MRLLRTFSQKERRWRRFSSGPREERGAASGAEEAEEEEEEEAEEEEGAVGLDLPLALKSASEVKPQPIKSGHQHSTPRSASSGSSLLNSRQEESKPWRQTTGGKALEEGEEEEGEPSSGPTKAVASRLETPSTGSSTLRILAMKRLAAGSVTSLPNSRGIKAGMASALSVAAAEAVEVEEKEEEEEEEEEEIDKVCRRSTIGHRRERWCIDRVAASLERRSARASARGRLAAERMAAEGERTNLQGD